MQLLPPRPWRAASPAAVAFWGGLFIFVSPELAPDPWAGVRGIQCAAGIRQRGEDQKKEEEPSTKLRDPYREIFFSIPVSSTKSKGSRDLLAQDLGLKVSAELFKPSALLWEGKY